MKGKATLFSGSAQFCSHLTFEQNCADLASASGRALGGIINKCKNMKNVGYKTFSKLYHSCVVPVMDYGSEIWEQKQKCIEDIQYRAGRYFLGTGKYTTLCSINSELGWDSCQLRWKLNQIRYYNRLIKMPSN